MTRLRGVIFACLVGAGAVVLAAVGCSSSSSPPAATGTEAGAEAGVLDGGSGSPEAAVDAGGTDAGNDAGLHLQWKVVLVASPPYGVVGGDGGAGEAGAAGDSGAANGADSAVADSAITDAAATDAVAADVVTADVVTADVVAAADVVTADVVAAADVVTADVVAADAVAAADAEAGGGGEGGLAGAPPLPGVQVCVYQNSAIPCVTTQADGTFDLAGLPARTNIALTLIKSGYLSYLVPIETASTDMDGRGNPVVMSPAGTPAPPLGIAIDIQNKGQITAFAVSIGGGASDAGANVDAGAGSDAGGGGGFVQVGGTHIALNPMSGSGPYFVNSANEYDLSATTFVGVTALYYNVDPGNYTLTYSNSAYDCEPISFPFGQFGFPVTTPAHSLKVEVVAGFVTGIVGVLCTKNPVIVSVDGG